MQPIADLLTSLEISPRLIVGMVREAPKEILKRRPASEVWSIHELACHIAHVHPLFFSRLDLILTEHHPVIKPYNPGVAMNRMPCSGWIWTPAWICWCASAYGCWSA